MVNLINGKAWNALAALACLSTLVGAQTFVWDEPYLMSMTTCSGGGNCSTPDQHRVALAESADGAAWTLIPGWGNFAYQGSVPDVIRRGDTVYIFTPNEVARYQLDTGTWLPSAPVALTDPDTTGGFVDPSAYIDDQGRLVLFYLLGILGSDPAGCNGAPTCIKYIHSATEVAGSDGTAFVVNPGHRLTVPTGGSDPPIASDPDIIRVGDEFIVLLSRGTSTQLWTSSDLHGTFALSTSLPGGFLWQNGPAVASGFHFDSTGEFWFYGHEFSAAHGTKVIRRAVVSSITDQVPAAAWTTVVGPNDLGLSNATELGSPGVALNMSGTAPGTTDCYGDGSGTPCPCGNSGGAGQGCRNTTGDGCELFGTGSASIGANDLVLHGLDALPGQPGLFFQGEGPVNGGNGLAFGDGLRCCGSNVVRLEVVVPDSAGTASSTDSISGEGGVVPGDTRCYQFWYRDPSGGGACGAGFNLSNSYKLGWVL